MKNVYIRKNHNGKNFVFTFYEDEEGNRFSKTINAKGSIGIEPEITDDRGLPFLVIRSNNENVYTELYYQKDGKIFQINHDISDGKIFKKSISSTDIEVLEANRYPEYRYAFYSSSDRPKPTVHHQEFSSEADLIKDFKAELHQVGLSPSIALRDDDLKNVMAFTDKFGKNKTFSHSDLPYDDSKINENSSQKLSLIQNWAHKCQLHLRSENKSIDGLFGNVSEAIDSSSEKELLASYQKAAADFSASAARIKALESIIRKSGNNAQEPFKEVASGINITAETLLKDSRTILDNDEPREDTWRSRSRSKGPLIIKG
jgi:hypothetical protein